MKRIIRKILIVTLSMALLLCPLSGCNKSSGAKEGELTIMYYDGSFGSQWLQNAADAFKAKKKAEGVEMSVKLIGDTNVGTTASAQLGSEKNLSDIYMLQSLNNFVDLVVQNKLEPLTDVYNAKVTTSDGEIAVKDYLLDDVKYQYYMQRVYGQGDYIPWALHWSMSQIGFVYNENILLATKHTTAKQGAWEVGDTWTAPPATVEDLLAYCADLKTETNGNKMPFVFAGGADSHWFRCLMQTWWAQYQGAYEINTLNITQPDNDIEYGSYYDFFNFKSFDVFKQEGMKKGIETVQEIFIDTSTGNWKNSTNNVNSYTVQDAARQFVRGDAAMVIGGSFMYNDVKDYLDDNLVFKMMHTPTIENAQQDGSGNTLKMNFYSPSDCWIVPKKATNKGLAKEFLAYLCNEECLIDFVKLTGSIRPFKCDVKRIVGSDYEETFNAYTKSCLEVYAETDVAIASVAANVEPKDRTIMSIYKIREINPNGTVSYPWMTFFADMKRLTPTQLMNNVYTKSLPDWNKWLAEYDIG